jgi:signal transduction histidine kinase
VRHVVDQLTAMLAAERFERPLVRRPVPVAALLQETARDVAPFLALRRQTLARDHGDDLGTITVDASKMRDGLNQLLLNAVKFTPDGGSITLGARRTADGGAEILVRDTGAGIDPTSLPHVFDPFFTVFDGSVSVECAVGRGSTFTVALPSGLAVGPAPPP